MSLVPAQENAFIRYWFGGTGGFARIGGSTNYMGICSGPPGESGSPTANENVYTGNRLIVDSFGNPYIDPVSGLATISHVNQVTWGSPAAPAIATHFVFSGGVVPGSSHNFYDTLAAPVNLNPGDTFRFRPNKVQVTLSGLFSMEGGTGAPAYRALENLADHGSLSDPTGFYWGLSSTAPNVDGTNVTEPGPGNGLTGAEGYAREFQSSVTTWTTSSTVGSSPTLWPNSTAVIWPEATASWGVMNYWVVYDAITFGNLMYYGQLDNPAEVVNGLQPQFAVGDLVVSCD